MLLHLLLEAFLEGVDRIAFPWAELDCFQHSGVLHKSEMLDPVQLVKKEEDSIPEGFVLYKTCKVIGCPFASVFG